MSGDQVKSIVQQLHDLSKEKANRVSIVKDNGCLPGLTLFLDNPDSEIVHLALETLLMLSEEAENQPIMYNDINFVKPIKHILENPKVPPKTKMTAVKLFRNIQPKPKVVQPPAPQAPATETPPPEPPRAEPRKAPGAAPFITVSSKTARNVRLKVAGVEEGTVRKQVQDSLLTVKGLVSFTFDIKQQYVDVRTLDSVQVSALTQAIGKAGLKAQQVIKGKDGEDVLVEDTEAAPKTDTDGYLDEEGTTYEKTVSGKTLTKVNDARNQKSGGWFSGVSSYLSKNLYW
eukprot:comp19797_c1_seq1/m.23767 comp19797_c1_seq1/g.23767  ORF comp19797_c1_seq1/g.23767 comp19797_c1_seq1/m.23767 type:complete len:287 (-) comp19797_c1_seq1:139-999(-)